MKRLGKRDEISYAKWGYIFILPFFIAFFVFQLIPMISTFYYSFFEYYRSGLTIIGPNPVGLENYQALFQSDFPRSSFHWFWQHGLPMCGCGSMENSSSRQLSICRI